MAVVLVVEDESLICEMTVEFLEDAGYIVVAVSNADAAVRILEQRTDIHFVFTDVDMPGSMDGLVLAAAVRDRWPPIHIIITSGKRSPVNMPLSATFIPKPYRASVVVAAMQALQNIA